MEWHKQIWKWALKKIQKKIEILVTSKPVDRKQQNRQHIHIQSNRCAIANHLPVDHQTPIGREREKNHLLIKKME